MPQIPFIVWAMVGVIPAVIVLLLLVEAKIVRPSVDEEQSHGDQLG